MPVPGWSRTQPPASALHGAGARWTESLDTLLQESEIVSCTCRAVPEPRG